MASVGRVMKRHTTVAFPRRRLWLFVAVAAFIGAVERILAARGTTETFAGFVSAYSRDHLWLILLQAACLAAASTGCVLLAAGIRPARDFRIGVAVLTVVYLAVWLVPSLMSVSSTP